MGMTFDFVKISERINNSIITSIKIINFAVAF